MQSCCCVCSDPDEPETFPARLQQRSPVTSPVTFPVMFPTNPPLAVIVPDDVSFVAVTAGIFCSNIC